MAYTWIPFYKELSQKLLQFKDDRKPLVDFIYSELSTVGSKSLVDYIHMEDGSKVKDIDPFNVDGMLLYAKTKEDVIDDTQVTLQDGYKLYVRSLDLNTDFDTIKKRLDSFIR